MKVVLDTSILIDNIRGGAAWKQFLISTEGDVDIYVPTIVIFELFSGKSTADPTVEKETLALVKNFKEVDLDSEIAKKAGELYREHGKHIGVQDYIIAATALSIGASVVTLNKKHFEQIPHVVLYKF